MEMLDSHIPVVESRNTKNNKKKNERRKAKTQAEHSNDRTVIFCSGISGSGMILYNPHFLVPF